MTEGTLKPGHAVRVVGGPRHDKRGAVKFLIRVPWDAPSAAMVPITFGDGGKGYQAAADPETIEGAEKGGRK